MLAVAVNDVGWKYHATEGKATVPRLVAWPNKAGILAECARLTCDVRHAEAEVADRMWADLKAAMPDCARRANVEMRTAGEWQFGSERFDPGCIRLIREAAQGLGVRHRDIPRQAGHDACYMSRIAPTAMIFTPCRDGISHTEAEHADRDTTVPGVNVLLHAVLAQANRSLADAKCAKIASMNLEIGSFRITDVRPGTATAIREGVLSLDRAALAAHLLEDARLSRAGIEIARPGESTRIIHVLDAVEPRVKVAGGPDFPGLLGRPELVGSGRTHRLDGVAVLSTCDVPGATDSQGLKEAIVDLAGPGAPYTPFGRTVNVVLELAVREGLPVSEAVAAIRRATLRAAVLLAEATRGREPDHVETLELGPVDPGLPRVAYVMPTMSEGEVHTTFFYGRSVQPLPAVVHPNEVLDGGLVSADYWIAGHRSPTYLYQNEPVIRAMYGRHGRDVNFVAVLLCRCLIIAEDDKLRQAVQAAKVARMLGLQGAVITMSNGGHAYVDQMLLCRELEQAGVATVLGVDEYSDTDGRDFPLVTYVPEAQAIVSVGNQEQIVEWPAVERVLGGTRFLAGNLQEKGFLRAPAEPLQVALRQIYCATNQLGWSALRGRAY